MTLCVTTDMTHIFKSRSLLNDVEITLHLLNGWKDGGGCVFSTSLCGFKVQCIRFIVVVSSTMGPFGSVCFLQIKLNIIMYKSFVYQQFPAVVSVICLSEGHECFFFNKTADSFVLSQLALL